MVLSTKLFNLYLQVPFQQVVKYIEVEWRPEWFINARKYAQGHWDSQENQRKFLDIIALQYNIINPSDWKRVTAALLRSKGGQVRASFLHCKE